MNDFNNRFTPENINQRIAYLQSVKLSNSECLDGKLVTEITWLTNTVPKINGSLMLELADQLAISNESRLYTAMQSVYDEANTSKFVVTNMIIKAMSSPANKIVTLSALTFLANTFDVDLHSACYASVFALLKSSCCENTVQNCYAALGTSVLCGAFELSELVPYFNAALASNSSTVVNIVVSLISNLSARSEFASKLVLIAPKLLSMIESSQGDVVMAQCLVALDNFIAAEPRLGFKTEGMLLKLADSTSVLLSYLAVNALVKQQPPVESTCEKAVAILERLISSSDKNLLHLACQLLQRLFERNYLKDFKALFVNRNNWINVIVNANSRVLEHSMLDLIVSLIQYDIQMINIDTLKLETPQCIYLLKNLQCNAEYLKVTQILYSKLTSANSLKPLFKTLTLCEQFINCKSEIIKNSLDIPIKTIIAKLASSAEVLELNNAQLINFVYIATFLNAPALDPDLLKRIDSTHPEQLGTHVAWAIRRSFSFEPNCQIQPLECCNSCTKPNEKFEMHSSKSFVSLIKPMQAASAFKLLNSIFVS